MKVSLQSRGFWIVFLGVALIAAIAAFQLMFTNLPSLKVDIHFSRAQAIAAATKFQQTQFPDLHTDRSTAAFISDRGLQNYVELEGGGLAAYQHLIGNLDAVTHYWKVRNFAESQEKELITAFSPKGEPISFSLTVPEKEAGAALDESAARVLAERGARDFMGARFEAYKPFESTMKRQTSGCVDYSFIYEHRDLKIGETQFRIELRVAGDKLVALDTFKHIPQAFEQRFSKMRALNTQISQIASYLMAGLLGLGGLVGGGVWLHRRHQLRLKRSFAPALFVGFGLAAAGLANLPGSWFNYNTTTSVNNFLLQQFSGIGIALVSATLLFTLIYAVAEGLSRMAFADHPRVFDSFRKPAAASPEVLGRVLGAYAWMGFFLLYAILFVVLTSKWLGWWQPTDTESDPNILASWRPALAPIFTALQAGTWEECLFRAVPLSLAAIIGARFGKKTLFVAVALVLQALIFGGAHANYPNLPGYSRLVELFIPAMVFGLVYLRFGLWVGMLTHFLYDLVLMSLPIFSAKGDGLWIDQLLVISAGLTPLLVVLWARYRVGSFKPLADEWRNGVPELVQPTEVAEASAVVPDSHPAHTRLFQLPTKLMIPLIIVSLVAIGLSLRQAPDIQWPVFQVDMAQAKAAGEAELAKHGVKLSGEWHRTSYITNSNSSMMEFVWKETDKTTFQKLIGHYVDTPYWVILWRKFDGPVERRSEDWEAWLYPDGTLHELVHNLPEGDAGAKLTREQATTKALAWIVEHQWGDANKLEEKSVEERVHPARSDWVVKYIDRAAFDQKNGLAIIKITISGDEVTSYYREINVPDEWSREQASKRSAKMPFGMVMGLLIMVLLGLAASSFFHKHSGRKLNLRVALPWMLLIGISNIVVGLMWIEGDLGGFQTTMGWMPQIWLTLGKLVLIAGALMLLLFFMAQAFHGSRPLVSATITGDLAQGLTLAAIFAGLSAIAKLTLTSSNVPLAYSADWATFVPLLTMIGNGGKVFFPQLFSLIFAIGIARFIRNRLTLGIVVVLFFTAWVAGILAADDMLATAINSFIRLVSLCVMIYLVRRQQLGVALAMLGGSVVFNQLYVSAALYASSGVHALISACVALVVTYGLVRHWHGKGIA